MRKLTFKGFLVQYIKALSQLDTVALDTLVPLAEQNLRLRYPIMLYAVYADKQSVLLEEAKNSVLYSEYSKFMIEYTADELDAHFKNYDTHLPTELHKIWNSYKLRCKQVEIDNQSKELMRRKIRDLQIERGISNYRIYNDLQLNPGNINAWLKHGNGAKVSIDTARRALKYVVNL